MFSKFFKREPAEPNRPEAALAAAPALLDQLLEAARDERGIRIETVVLALGSLAGHAAQQAAMDGLARGVPGYVGLSFFEVQGANGDSYWFGDAINRPLAEGPFSLWHAMWKPLYFPRLPLCHGRAAVLPAPIRFRSVAMTRRRLPQAR